MVADNRFETARAIDAGRRVAAEAGKSSLGAFERTVTLPEPRDGGARPCRAVRSCNLSRRRFTWRDAFLARSRSAWARPSSLQRRSSSRLTRAREPLPAGGRWPSKTTIGCRPSRTLRSHRADAGWRTPSPTRIEEDNGTRTEAYIVPADGGAPRRILHYGKDVANPRWSWCEEDCLEYTADRQQWRIDPASESAPPARIDSRPDDAATSADGKWIAFAREKPAAKKEARYASEFERKHEERFKGVTFDWKDFQRDGQPFPAPNQRARPSAEVVIKPAGGGDAKVLVDLDLRPDNLAWHPNGRLVAFTANSGWRDELKYERSDLWTVTTDGKLTRVTDGPYVARRPSVLAGRQVPVVFPHLRHRHGDREEAEPRRARGSLHPTGRGRRADQPDGDWDLEPGPDALGARRRLHLLHRGDRRREPSVPRLGARRPGRADDERGRGGSED